MNHQPWREFRKRLMGCVGFAIFCLIAPSAFAQLPDDVEPDAPAEPVVQNNFMMADENFEQWVFNNGTNSAQAKTKAETVLRLQIEDLDRICTLTEPQKKKLRLAGQGDLKRFYDLVEEKRRKFKAVQNDQQKFNEVVHASPPPASAGGKAVFSFSFVAPKYGGTVKLWGVSCRDVEAKGRKERGEGKGKGEGGAEPESRMLLF